MARTLSTNADINQLAQEVERLKAEVRSLKAMEGRLEKAATYKLRPTKFLMGGGPGDKLRSAMMVDPGTVTWLRSTSSGTANNLRRIEWRDESETLVAEVIGGVGLTDLSSAKLAAYGPTDIDYRAIVECLGSGPTAASGLPPQVDLSATDGTDTSRVTLTTTGITITYISGGSTTETFSTFLYKTTTGDPTGKEGLFAINTFDNNFKVYADGAWRSLATW